MLSHLAHKMACINTHVQREGPLKPHNICLILCEAGGQQLNKGTHTDHASTLPLLGKSTPIARKAGMLPYRISVIAGSFAALALAQLSRQDLAIAKHVDGNLRLVCFLWRSSNDGRHLLAALACANAHGIEQTTLME